MGVLDDYATGAPVSALLKKVDFGLDTYLSAAAGLHPNGKSFYNRLSPDDQQRMDEAIADRQAISRIRPDQFASAVEAFVNPARDLAAVAARAEWRKATCAGS